MACDLRTEWESSILASCQPRYMARRHAQAVRKHTVAVTAGGRCAVTTTSADTLGHLGRVLSVVGSLLNRNLTAAYWDRVEAVLPLEEVTSTAGGDGTGCDGASVKFRVVRPRVCLASA